MIYISEVVLKEKSKFTFALLIYACSKNEK